VALISFCFFREGMVRRGIAAEELGRFAKVVVAVRKGA